MPKPDSLTPQQRKELIERVLKDGVSVSQACRSFQISRPTFYKWLSRYSQAILDGKTPELSNKNKESIYSHRRTSFNKEKEILSVVKKYPKYSVAKLSQVIDGIGHHGIQNVLLRNGLNTIEKRQEFSQKQRQDLSLEKKRRMIQDYEQGVSLGRLCLKYGISRHTFYKWYKRYREAREENKQASLLNQRPKGERHWRFLGQALEDRILKLIVQHPQYSTHKIAQALPGVGNHGVQNVFKRHNLNTYSKRLAYAQAHVQPAPTVQPQTITDKVKQAIGSIPKVSAIPPPLPVPVPLTPRSRALRWLRTMAASTVSSFILGSALFFWIGILMQTPGIGGKIGILMATIALATGTFFFAYSMKYYSTLALVLSFSRQPLEGGGSELKFGARINQAINGNGNGNGTNGNKGWLARIFSIGGGHPSHKASDGINGSYQSLNGNGYHRSVQAGGLQPSLDHITLDRLPFVSVQLPLYNEKNVVERLLTACTSFDYYDESGQPMYEILVCDDSTDNTTKIIENFISQYQKQNPTGPKIKILHRPTREGFKGAALQNAMHHMDERTEFISVFDADFVPYPDTLKLFVKYFKANNPSTSSGQVPANGTVANAANGQASTNGMDSAGSPRSTVYSEDYTKTNIAVVGGYQWHVLNKSENWITRGVRTEYAGSYVVERPGREILGGLKQISGSVYMLRADVLRSIGWGKSITEDFQLTLKLYAKGYKVVYTPYVQAPSECVSTLKRLIRQRMRWAEGHSFNIKQMFTKLMRSPYLNFQEKLEFIYLAPYYLQAAFFMIGTLAWFASEAIFRTRLPFWTSLWGWSLVLTNLIALPLVNAVGMFMEEAEEKDYMGLLSFVVLSYIIVPFQAYAAIKGFIEPEEGTWFRTPKTGKITDVFKRGQFYRWISGIFPWGRRAPASVSAAADKMNDFLSGLLGKPALAPAYTQRSSAYHRFGSFHVRPKRVGWVSKMVLVILLSLSVTVYTMARGSTEVLATSPAATQYLTNDTTASLNNSWKMLGTLDSGSDSTTSLSLLKGSTIQRYAYEPGVSSGSTAETACANGNATGKGWLLDTPFETGGYITSGAWNFTIYESDTDARCSGEMHVCAYKVTLSSGSITGSTLIFDTSGMTTWGIADIIDGTTTNTTYTTDSISQVDFNANEYLFIQYSLNLTDTAKDVVSTFYTGDITGTDPQIVLPGITIPENVVFLLATVPFIPMVGLWLKKQQKTGKLLIVNPIKKCY
jgi:cellulose synthase/poly-beta-1,6-N-acetylglucosamine synthase-like glycosyltransferase/transposase-like protein